MKTFWAALILSGLIFTAEGCSRRNKLNSTAADDASTSGSSANGGRGKFTVGKTTTLVTGPVEADGHIDYAAALNERLAKGVTPANNAAVLLWKAIGPHPERTTMPSKFFDLLGAQIPEEGEYYVPLRRYVESQAGSGPGAGNASLDKLSRLAKSPWTSNQHPEISSWLKANEKPLALVIEATARTHYFSPMIPPRNENGSKGLINTLLPAAQLSRELGAALTVRAMLYLGHGYVDAAWQDLLDCHRLGRLVGRGGTLIEGLVGIAIDSIASKGDLAFLDYAKPDAKRIESCLNDLRGLPALPDIAEKVDLCERFTFLDNIMQIDRLGIGYLTTMGGGANAQNPAGELLGEEALQGIDWNPALEIANHWYDRLASALREKNRPERVRKLDQIEAELRSLKDTAIDRTRLARMLKEGNDSGKAKGRVVGEILISLLMPAASKVQGASDRASQTLENVAVAFALAWYQRDQGRYPDRLDALIPNYLGQVPQDIFSGNALIYRPAPNGYLLYSVGLNGRDDGGRGAEDQPPGDDLVVRMPLALPR